MSNQLERRLAAEAILHEEMEELAELRWRLRLWPMVVEGLERIATFKEVAGGDWMDGPEQGIARVILSEINGEKNVEVRLL